MNMTYWVFTDGNGNAYINLSTQLNANKPVENSTFYWGTAFIKKAGVQVNYDVGLCNHTYFENIDFPPLDNETTAVVDDPKLVNSTGVHLVTDVYEEVYQAPLWAVEDYWFPYSPFNQGEKFYDMLKSGLDTSIKNAGNSDWSFQTTALNQATAIDNSIKVAFRCDIIRLMNTQDYKDVKVEIYLTYNIQSFYYLVNPPGSKTKINPDVYGNSQILKIKILDFAVVGMTIFYVSTSLLYMI